MKRDPNQSSSCPCRGDLQRTYANGQERKSDEVEAGAPLPRRASTVDLRQGDRPGERQSANWNVDVENPAPRVVVSDPSSQRWTNSRRADAVTPYRANASPRFSEERYRPGWPVPSAAARLRTRLAIRETGEEAKVGRDTAQEGTDCEKYDTGQEERFRQAM